MTGRHITSKSFGVGIHIQIMDICTVQQISKPRCNDPFHSRSAACVWLWPVKIAAGLGQPPIQFSGAIIKQTILERDPTFSKYHVSPCGNTNCVETAAVSSVCVHRVLCPIAACLLIDDGPWLILLRQNTCPSTDTLISSNYQNMELWKCC